MPNPFLKKTSGVTLLELLIAIAVIGITLTIAVPSVQDFLRNNRVASQNNEMVALITLAKSQAIRRNEDWQVQLIANGAGWSGEVRPRDALGLEQELDAGCPERVNVIRCSDFQGVGLNEGGTMTFNNRGYLEAADGSFSSRSFILTHPGCSSNRQRRQITVLATGQITSDPLGCP